MSSLTADKLKSSSLEPDHHDAELVLRCYELRRESVMRQSRDSLNLKFWPKTYDEFLGVTKPDHPLNAAFRQVSGYWEMVYGFVKHGAVNAELFMDSNGEGLFFYSKILPFVERFRNEVSPLAFRNCEWVAQNTELGRERMKVFEKRLAQLSEQLSKV